MLPIHKTEKHVEICWTNEKTALIMTSQSDTGQEVKQS